MFSRTHKKKNIQTFFQELQFIFQNTKLIYRCQTNILNERKKRESININFRYYMEITELFFSVNFFFAYDTFLLFFKSQIQLPN